MANFTKEDRIQHANDLIKVISDHGRRFFFHKGSGRVAHIRTDERGRICYVDDYSGVAVDIQRSGYGNSWAGFSHGGTLRSLVEAMRDYIVTGKKLSPYCIAPERIDPGSNIWGYGLESAEAVRAAAFKLPIIDVPNQTQSAVLPEGLASTSLEFSGKDVERHRRHGQVTRSGVVYDEELAGSGGMSFVLLREVDTTDDMLEAAARQLRQDRDVVGSIKVTSVIPAQAQRERPSGG